jgi:hypothetical protein
MTTIVTIDIRHDEGTREKERRRTTPGEALGDELREWGYGA